MARKQLEEQTQDLDFSRVEHLLTPKELENKKVTVVGVGSGGYPVVQHLTMNGIKDFDLFDFDILEPENLIKHPGTRKDLGKFKVDILKNWIEDRNPQATVNAYKEDVIKSEHFKKSVEESDLVLICPDKKHVREYVNDTCIKTQTHFVEASVFRTGIGGQILGCKPGITGCYRCFDLITMKNNMVLTEEHLGLTQDEEHKIYGLGNREYRASGLSIDIQMIALIQARMALSMLHPNPNFEPLPASLVVFANRPREGIFTHHFQTTHATLKPQKDCLCYQKGEKE